MKKDFKMAILIPSLIKTAPNMIALTLYRYAKARYGDVSLYYLDPVVNSGKEFIDATDAIHLTDKNILKEFDIVHSHGLRPDIVNFFYTKKIKLSTIHSFITKDLTEKYGIKGFVFSKIWLFFLAKFNSCAVMSNYASNYYSKISCCVIPNGIDKSSFCKSDEYFSLQQIIHEKKQQNKIVVGTVAALER
ncbi:hypothetical protein [Pectobacterium cacticida]|uniref:hypothetical protein n=1 Tax=Pectobacterium cacticida TaxID=69221 RepID=UPI0035EA09B9